MNIDEVKARVIAAVGKFRKNDIALIMVDAHERSMSHKLAQYVQEQFNGWDVDCEYNRHGSEPKEILENGSWRRWANAYTLLGDEKAKTIYPDIVVHRRLSDEDNLLVVEVKKSTTVSESKLDIDKLEALTSKNYEYRYHFGVQIVIAIDWHGNLADKYNWYEDGEASP